MISYRLVGFMVVPFFLGIVLTGCAGIEGAPDPVIQTDEALTDLNAYL
jgi:hypothetical protein